MSLNWKSIGTEHVRQACEKVASQRASSRTSGIVIWHHDRALPAKEVLRVAYRLANELSDDAEVRFSSGDGTLRVLSERGFKVERLGTPRGAAVE